MEEEVTKAQELIRQLISDGWSADEVAIRFCLGLGSLIRESADVEHSLTSARSMIERLAGVQSDSGLALQMPCPRCWDAVMRDVAEREFTGSATKHCPHRELGFVIHAKDGKATRWSVGPMTSEEADDRNREVRKAVFRKNGLSVVH